jgi:hypothetical protein
VSRVTPGNYVPLDVNYVRDSAIRRAGEAAELLYVRSLAYAKGARSCGLVPDYDLPVVAIGLRGVTKRVAQLVANGLWIETDGGWQIRSWARWNDDHDALTSELSDSGVWGSHQRWHVKGGKPSADCVHCLDNPPNTPPISPTPVAPHLGGANSKGREGKGRETSTPSATADAAFDQWWAEYPKKVGKAAARKAYTKALKTTEADTIAAGLKAQLPKLLGSEDRFRPNPATWLNEGRWDDEVQTQPPAAVGWWQQ